MTKCKQCDTARQRIILLHHRVVHKYQHYTHSTVSIETQNMQDQHYKHDPHGDKPTTLKNVKITMTYVPAVAAGKVEGTDDHEEENMALEQTKSQILNGIIGRSTTYILQPCQCTTDLIKELQELSDINNNNTN